MCVPHFLLGSGSVTVNIRGKRRKQTLETFDSLCMSDGQFTEEPDCS